MRNITGTGSGRNVSLGEEGQQATPPGGPKPEQAPITASDAAAPAFLPADGLESMARSMFQLNFKPGGSSGAATATTSKPSMQAKIDSYFDHSNIEYTLPDGSKARALPHFRMNSGDDGAFFEHQLLRVLKPGDRALRKAIHMVAYGRGTPEQIKMVTQALIDKGGIAAEKKMWERKGEAAFKAAYPNTSWPLSDADAIRLLQWSMGVGIDCAGYVQQEFVAVHGGKPADYGFQSIGDENLSSLKGNRHFAKVSPADAQVGDLMILDPPTGEKVGHTVMIQDHHLMTDAERASFPGIDSFAKPGDKVDVYVVEASFGSGGNGDPARGGVQRRTFFFNETTGKWADMRRDWDRASSPTVHISGSDGPYDHPMNGIFHPKGKGTAAA